MAGGYYDEQEQYRKHTTNDPYRNENSSTRDSDNNEGKLFVGGLAWETSEDSITQYFSQFGEVQSVTLKKNKEDNTKHRGFAFVKFMTQEGADAVLKQTEAHVLDGSRIDPKSACPIGVKPEQRTKKIFVGGLQTETTEEKLMEYFEKFGKIQNNIEFAVDKVTKKKRGFCFIEFASEAIVDKIVKDKYHEIAGKRVETKRALSRQQQEQLKAADTKSVYGGAAYAAPQYGSMQPVIYIHPDALSTAYPGMMTYPNIGQYTQQGMESLYQPYAQRDSRGAQVPNPRVRRPEPYAKQQ